MKYKSKIDWWFNVVVIVFLVSTAWLFIDGILERLLSVVLMGILFLLIDSLVILPIRFNTYYVLNDSFLYIKCGLFPSIQIPYKNITFVDKTRSPLSSPALSMDRIEIGFADGKAKDLVFISPENKEEFIKELNTILDAQ